MISIRPGTMEDISACALILTESGQQAFGFAAWPVYDAAAFQSVTQDEDILIAERDGLVIGFAAIYTRDAPYNFLHHLYVHPAASGQGAGRLLLAAVVAQFGPCLSLKAQLSNRRARRFYADAGWVEDGQVQGVDATGPWITIYTPA